jgi:hypothetical protein
VVRVLTADFFLLCGELLLRFIDLSVKAVSQRSREVPEP